MCMVEIRNRKTLQSKVNIFKSDVKIGDYADSLSNSLTKVINTFAQQLKQRGNTICYKYCASAICYIMSSIQRSALL